VKFQLDTTMYLLKFP